MLQGPLLLNIITYTVPVILTGILQLLFNAADLVIVGRFCGSVSVAAVGATGSITNLIVNLFIGISVGAGVTVAHAYGGRLWEAVHRTVHTALPTALVSGIFLTAVGISLSERLLTMMGTPQSVLPLSTVYMKIYFAGITFTMVYNFCASILRAAGDTKPPLIFLSIAGVVNVALNVVFVTMLHMNVAGVALATVVSQAISAILVVITLMRRTDACKLELKKMRFYKVQLLKILRIGLPAGIQSSVFSLSNVVIQSSVNSFGSIVIAGNAASSNVGSFIYQAMNTFQQAVTCFASQNVGARKPRRIFASMKASMVWAIIVGLILGALSCIFGETLLSLYSTDPAVISAGMERQIIVCAPYFLCGMMDVMTGALRGIGYSILPMAVSILGACVFRIFWVVTIFKAFPTLGCLMVSYPVSWLLTFIALVIFFNLIWNRRVKQHFTDEELRGE